jgi:hypothetical protein
VEPLDLGELDREQAELMRLVDDMTAEPDGDRKQALVKRISEQSERLQRLCDDLERRARAEARDLRGTFDVELTAEQRATVKERTGVTMDRLSIEDDGGGLISVMPTMGREQILELALEEADRRRRDADARRAAELELARVSEELRRDAPEQVRQEVDRLLEDPQFRAAFEPRRAR